MNSLTRQSNAIRSPATGGGQPRFRQLTHKFDLMRHLVWRDFALRYKQSVLGILWSLLLPLSQLLVLIFLFQSVVPLNIDAYPVFVFTALLPWSWFSSSVGSACNLFWSNRDLVRRPDFAPSALMLINTLSNLLTYLVALPFLFVMLALYHFAATPALLLLPVLLLIQGVMIVGLSLLVATANVFFRDMQHLVGIALTLLFYLTPVFYRPQSVVHDYQALYALNPIAVLIQCYRAIFFYGVMPPWQSLLFVALSSIAIWLIGLLVYSWNQHDIVDLI